MRGLDSGLTRGERRLGVVEFLFGNGPGRAVKELARPLDIELGLAQLGALLGELCLDFVAFAQSVRQLCVAFGYARFGLPDEIAPDD